jgi:uncharacterized protein
MLNVECFNEIKFFLMLNHLKFTIQQLKFLTAFSFVFIASFSFAQKAMPELWGQRVHDEAHILKPETIDSLEKELKVHEDSTSNQIAILIVQSLDGDVLEDYSIRVVEKWKLGKSDKDNGVLLLVAVDDHKMRIEVGHGLEGVLTDAQSSRIIRDDLAPLFRRGDYDAGIRAGISAIIKTISGEYKTDASSEDNTWTIVAILFAVVCVVILIATFVNEFRSKGEASNQANSSKGKSTSSAGRNIFSGTSSGSSWSSGSSSGSSFSGGGGSFGGGGSSGSW